VRVTCPTHFVLFLSLCLNTPQPRTLFSNTLALRPSFSVPDKVFVQLHEFMYPLSHRQLLPSSCNINLWMRSYLCKFISIPYRIQYTIITCLKAFGLILCKVDACCLSVCLYSISHSENLITCSDYNSTRWSRALEQQMATQLVTKCPALYAAQMFITVLIKPFLS